MSNKKDMEIIKSLIAGGIIGGGLAALFSKKKKNSDDMILASIAGAAIAASYTAFKEAEENNLPVFIKEGNIIFEKRPDGTKVFIKELGAPTKNIPRNFKLS